MGQKSKNVRETGIRAKIAKLDAYVEDMNTKGSLADMEMKEVMSAMQKTNKYLRAIEAPESSQYDI